MKRNKIICRKVVKNFPKCCKSEMLALSLVLFLINSIAFSQSLTVFGLDATNFPTIKAKFYAFDNNWEQITNLNKNDFKIAENGITRNIVRVECKQPKPANVISSILVMDASASMLTGEPINNLALVKESAKAWITGLPDNKSECAIVAFDSRNYMMQDFTTDKSLLLSKADKLFAGGGTDYDAAMLEPLSGGLEVSKRAKYKKVIVFLSDGLPNKEPKINEIIDEALKQDVTIFSVTVGFPCPYSMREMALKTGGLWFENVTTLEQAREIYSLIQKFSIGNEPCEIEWLSENSCTKDIEAEINLIPLNKSNIINYSLPSNLIADLMFSTFSLKFLNQPVGIPKDTIVKVTAVNSDFNITNIISTNNSFKITPVSFQLKSGQSLDLTISYTPLDSGYNYADFLIKNNICDKYFYASGGFIGRKPNQQFIKLNFPNGGELLVAGSDTSISWSNIAASDTVYLEYSTDSGNSWKMINESASNLNYRWKVPKTPSNNCLANVRQVVRKSEVNDSLLWSSMAEVYAVAFNPVNDLLAVGTDKIIMIIDKDKNSVEKILTGHLDNVTCLKWLPDGKRLISSSNDNTLKEWDINLGIAVNSIKAHNNKITKIDLSEDGNTLVSGSEDLIIKVWDTRDWSNIRTVAGEVEWLFSLTLSPDASRLAWGSYEEIKIWSVSTGMLEARLIGHTDNVTGLEWSNDGNLLASSSDDGTIKIWDASSGNMLRSINNYNKINAIIWNKDNTRLLSGVGSTVIIWNVLNGSQIAAFSGHDNIITSLDWSITNNYFVTGSLDRSAKIWNIVTSDVFLDIRNHNGVVSKVDWSNDGLKIASSSSDRKVKLWNTQNNREYLSINAHNSSINAICWSPDDRFIATASDDRTIKVWNTSNGVNVFTITSQYYYFRNLSWSPDGTKLLSNTNDYHIRIWNADNGDSIIAINNSKDYLNVNSLDWSPDGTRFVAALTNRTARVYDLNGNISLLLTGSTSYANVVAWSPDGKMIALGDGSGSVSFYSSTNGILIKSVKTSNYSINCLSWNPDSKRIAVGTSEKNFTIWNVEKSKLLQQITRHNSGILSLDWNPDGTKIVSGSSDGTLKVWFPEFEIQSDMSDNLWTIIVPQPASKDVIMNYCFIGESIDSTINDFVKNIGIVKFRVDSIYFKGADSKNFSIVSGIFPYEIEAGKGKFQEIRFTPVRVGLHQATIVIITQADTLEQTIYGRGIEKEIEVISEIIDFGKVDVGKFKDTLGTATIKNIGKNPIKILKTEHNKPNLIDFSTLAGGGEFIIEPGTEAILDLRFSPSDKGQTSGTLEFHYEGIGSPAIVQLFGEGVKDKPVINIQTANLPDILCDSSSNAFIKIQNIGGSNLIISELNITGINSDDFFYNTSLPIIIQPDDIYDLEIGFKPLQSGPKNAMLQIVTNSDINPVNELPLFAIKNSPEFKINNKLIELGNIPLNNSKNGNFILHNSGTLQNTYNIFSSSKILLSENIIVLEPNETRSIDLTFSGEASPSQIQESITVRELTCNQEQIIEISGKVFSASAELKTNNLEAYPGDEIEVPIILNSFENLNLSGVYSINAELFFNPTLLVPIDYNFELIDNKTARINLEKIPVSDKIGSVLKSVRFKVGLGNAENCGLILENVVTNGGIADISLINGTFTLLGICYEGGTRLVNPDRITKLMKISPNPSDGNVNIELNLVEKGITTIKVFDSNGQSIDSREFSTTGNLIIELDTKNYSNGMYFIQLQTPTVLKKEKLIIYK